MSLQTPEQQQPLVYSSGKISWSSPFQQSAAVKALLAKHKLSKEQVQDLGMYLYFVFSYASMYRDMPEKDRFSLVLRERCQDAKWLESFVSDQLVIELAQYYRQLILTPGQRLYFGLVEEVQRYLREVSEADVKEEGEALLKRLDLGKRLYKSEKEIQAMIREERTVKIKGGYVPQILERKPNER